VIPRRSFVGTIQREYVTRARALELRRDKMVFFQPEAGALVGHERELPRGSAATQIDYFVVDDADPRVGTVETVDA
jgi:hypothetical protein